VPAGQQQLFGVKFRPDQVRGRGVEGLSLLVSITAGHPLKCRVTKVWLMLLIQSDPWSCLSMETCVKPRADLMDFQYACMHSSNTLSFRDLLSYL